MARIADGVIEQLKQTVSLERLAEVRGIALKRHGADLIGCCPFHEDRTPSLVITPAKNLWHCLGACQQGGTVIDWVMKAEGVSFRHAVELLQNNYSPLAASTALVKRSSVKKLTAPIEHDVEDAKLLVQVIDYYHQALLQSPEAMKYLEKRGIASPDAVKHFKLGFANRTLGYRLPDANRAEGAAIRGRLQKLGLLRESGHEHFNGSLVIPVINEQGEVTGVYGRKITPNLTQGTPKHLYLPGPHRGIWNAAALTAAKEIILCEALIDALTFWCAGFRNVTASYGVEGFTADHLAAFKANNIERVLIAYDRDDAGDGAAEKLAKQLIGEGFNCYRIEFPKGMDANEYARKLTPPEKSLELVIRKARLIGGPADRNDITEPLSLESSSLVATAPSMTERATSVIPPSPAAELPCEQRENEVVMHFAERRYRIRGLQKNQSVELMRVNVMVSVGERFHIDSFDFYAAKARASFATVAAIELQMDEQIIKHDLGRVLLKLEALQATHVTATLAPATPAFTMSPVERDAAFALLRDPKLIERIAGDFARAGIVGEESNALVGYLAAISRKLDKPLALLIQSTSAAGKSSLMDAVLKFVPEEDRIVYSAMTGQSLFYMGEMDLKHKILAIAEEEGAHRASYALKLLQSDGELTIASTSKDPDTGKLATDQYRVEGPVMIFSTTTAADLDEELQNRCLVLGVDESREQTQAIHRAQRERRTLAGLQLKAERASLLKLHQNAQRLIEPLAVMNPYADHLTFIDDRTRTRRDHEKYLTLIDVIALLYQHQRPIKTSGSLRYIEVTLDDTALANRLAHDVLGRTLDELPPQTRRLLSLMVEMCATHCKARDIKQSEYRFSRREVREYTRWGDTQLKIHLARLVELEYVLMHRGGRGQSFEYELLYDGSCDAQHHLSGLIDVEALRCIYDGERSGQNDHRSGVGRPLVGPRSGGGRSDESLSTIEKSSLKSESTLKLQKTHGTRGNGHASSYVAESL
jgi:DNA primase